MSDTLLKSTTRHVRIFTAKVINDDLVPDTHHLTMDLDPDNEFIWTDSVLNKVNNKFQELIDSYSEKELSDYNLRKIGSELEGEIKKLLQAGELTYNPDSRVLNYSMGLPRTPELL
tara:strand:+ start:1133 stop:1480 length:348 start_codon:yes stop_codon:yes gene_type:complete